MAGAGEGVPGVVTPREVHWDVVFHLLPEQGLAAGNVSSVESLRGRGGGAEGWFYVLLKEDLETGAFRLKPPHHGFAADDGESCTAGGGVEGLHGVARVPGSLHCVDLLGGDLKGVSTEPGKLVRRADVEADWPGNLQVVQFVRLQEVRIFLDS